jgi:GntR family transcriptional regulator
MDILVNRKGGVPVRDQIRTQMELKILGGELEAGERLPSVRSLARRLKVHPNTISAAYQELEAAGHLELKAGSGVFVRRARPSRLEEARGLDEMIRVALQRAFDQGYSGEELRAAVRRWLDATPPDRILVVDPAPEMAQLVAHELRRALRVPVAVATLEGVEREPMLLSGALAVVLPHNVGPLRDLAPGAALEAVTLEVAEDVRRAIRSLPEGAIVLGVTHSSAVLPFASVLFRSLRGDDLILDLRLLSATKEWQRLVRVADAVFADALSVEAVKKERPKRLVEVRVVSEDGLARLRDALTVVVPRVRSQR